MSDVKIQVTQAGERVQVTLAGERAAVVLALRGVADSLEGGLHDVEWHGTFRGTDSDPRETGYCEKCRREVYDGDSEHHSNRPVDEGAGKGG